MTPAMLTLALQGFRDAHTRHDSDRLTADPMRVFISVAECIYWSATIDERLRDDWAGYTAFTETNPMGLLLPGVRYVRNLKTHSLLKKIEGAIFPIVFPMIFAEVVWLPLDQLPRPGRTSRYTPLQERAYAEHMAGTPTRHTLHRLMEGFADIEALPNSPFAAAA